MDLPKLHSGKRYTLPRPTGSADALLLARLGERDKAGGKPLAIITSNASDAQRLLEEIAFFAPSLRCALFPDWETLPYDTFSPHQDLISERLATLWRISQRDKDTGADVIIVPATTALYRLAPPSFLAGYTFQFKVKQKLDEAKLKSQLTLAGYSHVTQVVSPGEYAVRGGLIDLFPMGSLVPTASAACTPFPRFASCRAGNSQWTMMPVRVFAAAGANFWMATQPRAAFTKTSAMESPQPVLSTTCRCFLTTRPQYLTILAKTPQWCCTATWNPHFSAFGKTPKTATAWYKATQTAPLCRQRAYF
jgi:hypothetical protein